MMDPINAGVICVPPFYTILKFNYDNFFLKFVFVIDNFKELIYGRHVF